MRGCQQNDGLADGAGEDDDEMDDAFSAEIMAEVVAESKALSPECARCLHRLLPVYQQVNNWKLLYSSTVHGADGGGAAKTCCTPPPRPL